MRTRRSLVAGFAVLMVSVVAVLGQTKTSDDVKPKPWPHGPYDKLMVSPAPKPSAMPLIVEPPPTGSNQPPKILIYHGTQREEVGTTSTNRLAPPTLKLQNK
jgi:hypothetical protein